MSRNIWANRSLAQEERQTVATRRINRPKATPLTLAVTGDVMLGRLMNEVIHRRGPFYPWGNTIGLLKNADLTLANLECVIASSGKPWTRTPKVFHFKADPEAIRVLEVAGTDYVSLANNHTLDFEEDALLEMLDRLAAAHIAHAGAGRNLKEAERPAWLTAKGRKIAVFSFTDNEPDWAATDRAPGINFVPISIAARQFTRLRKSIRLAREGGADLVIASAHWGPNMRERPTPSFVAFTHALMDAGVDIFHGHSAHILQGIEIYKGKPILYDTGDFVDDYAVDPFLRNDQSALFRLEVSNAARIDHIDIFPVLIENFQVNLAEGDDFQAIADRIRHLCREMGTDVIVTDTYLRITISKERQEVMERAS
ncbi:MAG: CapA family protein [Chloroflexi bacterium]|nr:CapA family protein [Chloroflexota bacterium]